MFNRETPRAASRACCQKRSGVGQVPLLCKLGSCQAANSNGTWDPLSYGTLLRHTATLLSGFGRALFKAELMARGLEFAQPIGFRAVVEVATVSIARSQH